MRPYSIDIRQRVLAAVEAGEYSFRELASLFNIHFSTIVRLLQRFRDTGSVEPKPHGGGARPKLDAEATARLLDLVRQQPDATLAELRQRLGVDCNLVTIFRTLKRMGITRKKKTRFADERDSPRVQEQRRVFVSKWPRWTPPTWFLSTKPALPPPWAERTAEPPRANVCRPPFPALGRT